MGEYLSLMTKEGIEAKGDMQHLGGVMREVDRRLNKLVKLYFRYLPRMIEELNVHCGEISTKLATCEEVFFTFPEMVALYNFIREHKTFFVYGENHSYNMTPEQILKDRKSLYIGAFQRGLEKRKLDTVVPEAISKQIEHYECWQKYFKTVSKNGKTYYKKVAKSQTDGCYGNSNGKQIPCKNHAVEFKASKSGFAWDWETNKGRTLYNCPKCKVTFNMGENPTPDYAHIAKQLKTPIFALPVEMTHK